MLAPFVAVPTTARFLVNSIIGRLQVMLSSGALAPKVQLVASGTQSGTSYTSGEACAPFKAGWCLHSPGLQRTSTGLISEDLIMHMLPKVFPLLKYGFPWEFS